MSNRDNNSAQITNCGHILDSKEIHLDDVKISDDPNNGTLDKISANGVSSSISSEDNGMKLLYIKTNKITGGFADELSKGLLSENCELKGIILEVKEGGIPLVLIDAIANSKIEEIKLIFNGRLDTNIAIGLENLSNHNKNSIKYLFITAPEVSLGVVSISQAIIDKGIIIVKRDFPIPDALNFSGDATTLENITPKT